ncbi:hypothetical protein VTK26DRAFT_5210 [Humicola hyalothermophila]
MLRCAAGEERSSDNHQQGSSNKLVDAAWAVKLPDNFVSGPGPQSDNNNLAKPKQGFGPWWSQERHRRRVAQSRGRCAESLEVGTSFQEPLFVRGILLHTGDTVQTLGATTLTPSFKHPVIRTATPLLPPCFTSSLLPSSRSPSALFCFNSFVTESYSARCFTYELEERHIPRPLFPPRDQFPITRLRPRFFTTPRV